MYNFTRFDGGTLSRFVLQAGKKEGVSTAQVGDSQLDGGSASNVRRSLTTRFTDTSGAFSQEATKGVLVNTAEKVLSALHDILTESAEQGGGKKIIFPLVAALFCYSSRGF